MCGQVSLITLGARMDLSAINRSPSLELAWRVRLETNSEGSVQMVPQRPVAVLNGILDMKSGDVSRIV